MPAAKKEPFSAEDFVSHEDAEADLEENGEDLGSDPDADVTADDDDDGGQDAGSGKPAKKAAKKTKKTAADEEDEEEADDEEEEEEGDEDEEEEEEEGGKPKKSAAEIQLEKKLTRTSKARENLENQLREARAQLEEKMAERSDAGKAKIEKLMADLDALYEEVEEHRAAGLTKEAAAAQRKIDAIRDGMTRQQAAFLASKNAMEQTELRAYNTMVKELEFLDPRFDPDHDDFDQEMLDDLSELIEGFEGKGFLLTDALRKATKLMLREDVFAKGRSLKRDKPSVKAEPRKTDVKKNLKDAKKLPPDTPGGRKEKATAEINMETISEKDFDALPESTLRRYLNGDIDS